MISVRKIAIIGAGYVGSSIAYSLMLRELADEIVMIDLNVEHAQGEAEDIVHGISYMGVCKVYQGNYQDCINCNMIIITAGINRKSGQTRMDLIDANLKIINEVVAGVKPYYTDSVILVVSNPVDIMTYAVAKKLGVDSKKVLGTGCILDTSRFICQLADYVELSINSIQAMIVGEHGERQIPLWSRVSVANSSIEEYCEMSNMMWDQKVKDKIMKNVREMGADIIAKKERTHYGIATCVCYLVDSIMNNHKIVVPVCSTLENQYMGVNDLAISVPTVVGREGVICHLHQEWEPKEIEQFLQSSHHISEALKYARLL